MKVICEEGKFAFLLLKCSCKQMEEQLTDVLGRYLADRILRNLADLSI